MFLRIVEIIVFVEKNVKIAIELAEKNVQRPLMSNCEVVTLLLQLQWLATFIRPNFIKTCKHLTTTTIV